MADHSQWDAARALVDAALELPAESRIAFIEASSANPSVRIQALRWLDACDRADNAGDFLAWAAADRAMPMLVDQPIFETHSDLSAAEQLAALTSALAPALDVEREVGRGGMATVYLARDLRHRRRVAVKVLHPNLTTTLGAERFLREIELTAELQHPHILPLFDSGSAAGQLYYVMPYVEGETLRDRLARDGPLSIAETIQILREVASALDYAHRKGVVHRDVKPGNILLTDGHAIVADFGIARALRRARELESSDELPDTGGSVASLTDAGTSPGTPGYMAPEQARGGAVVDYRADLYSLGVVAKEMIAEYSDATPALADLVSRLLAIDPASRPQSAAEVIAVLDGVRGAPSVLLGNAARRPLDRTAKFVLALIVIAAVLGLGAYAVRRDIVARRDAKAGEGVSIHSIAVLPFANVGPSVDDYLSDGLTDELAHALAQLPGLSIVGRTSSYAYKGKAVPAQDVGRSLGVGAIVGGTVQRAGERLRVSTQLVSTSDGRILWDSLYESRASDAFAVQDELTRAIATAVSRAVGSRNAGRSAIDVSRGTADQEAYDLYLKGRYHWLQRGAANLAKSIEYYQQAIARDPTFARAHAGLAMAYSTLPSSIPNSLDSAVLLTEASANRAAALDSTLAESQLALGIIADGRLRLRDALARYRAAIATDPSSVTGHHWLGLSLLNLGFTDEALVELRHATELDPLSTTPASAFAIALVFARRFPEARVAARRALALDSAFAFAIWPLGLAEAFGGQPDSAVLTFERGARLHPDDSRMLVGLAVAYVASGRWSDAKRIQAQLRAPGGDRSGWSDPEFAELLFGNRHPLVRALSTRATVTRYVASGALLGCNPLLDPLWLDTLFVSAMRHIDVERCTLARPWPFADGAGR